jgi:glutamyl/glutaminyl-tRNA synthetase
VFRSRIAPTPSGFLHTGNACSFLLTEQIVRRANGQLRLRIDDLDAPRARREYVEDIFETLHWLGIAWDEGPRDAEEHYSRYSQQLRGQRYHQYIDALIAGGQVFACSCSRKEIQDRSADGQYPGTCRNRGIPLDTPGAALRVRTPDPCIIRVPDEREGLVEVNLAQTMRDFVIRRRDGIPAYHIASLADDVDFDINYIVRGADLLHSTAAQLYLASLLGETKFTGTRFLHHPLLTDEGGNKLSKSAGSVSLKSWRERGQSPETLRRMAARWL